MHVYTNPLCKLSVRMSHFCPQVNKQGCFLSGHKGATSIYFSFSGSDLLVSQTISQNRAANQADQNQDSKCEHFVGFVRRSPVRLNIKNAGTGINMGANYFFYMVVILFIIYFQRDMRSKIEASHIHIYRTSVLVC